MFESLVPFTRASHLGVTPCLSHSHILVLPFASAPWKKTETISSSDRFPLKPAREEQKSTIHNNPEANGGWHLCAQKPPVPSPARLRRGGFAGAASPLAGPPEPSAWRWPWRWGTPAATPRGSGGCRASIGADRRGPERTGAIRNLLVL